MPHLLSLGLQSRIRATMAQAAPSPARDRASLVEHNTTENIARTNRVKLFVFHYLSAHFPSLPSPSDGSPFPCSLLHRWKWGRATQQPTCRDKGKRCFKAISRAELLCCHWGALAWVQGHGDSTHPCGNEPPRAHLAFLGSSASYLGLQAEGPGPQLVVMTLKPDWRCYGANLQVMQMSTNVKADLQQLRSLLSPWPILQE